MTGANRRVPFDESWLPVTAQWLTDPELAHLTMAGEFTPERQREWFSGLATRTDYAVWGIEHDGERVGVLGIKSIGEEDGAEYFMYLGDRQYWGRGIAAWAFAEIVAEVRRRGLPWLYGRIAKYNERSLAVHLREGFQIARDDGDTYWVAYPVGPA